MKVDSTVVCVGLYLFLLVMVKEWKRDDTGLCEQSSLKTQATSISYVSRTQKTFFISEKIKS